MDRIEREKTFHNEILQTVFEIKQKKCHTISVSGKPIRFSSPDRPVVPLVFPLMKRAVEARMVLDWRFPMTRRDWRAIVMD